jgi:hypothetical protein
MVRLFFYNKLMNIELIKRINHFYDICDGYILMQKYDSSNNVLEISDKLIDNNQILHGKIVDFNMSIHDVVNKINEFDECKLENKIKYTLEEIWTNKTFGGTCKAYIIY